jgi:Peptidase family M23
MIKLILILALLVKAVSTPAPVAEIWAEPIPYLYENLEEDYLAPASEYGTGHRGIDFHVEPGQPIQSPAAGTVHFVGKVVNRHLITIRTDKGKLASFEPVCSQLKAGERVSAGQPIGIRCDGDSTYEAHCESCIHASARDNFGYLSPLHMLGQKSPSVLLS